MGDTMKGPLVPIYCMVSGDVNLKLRECLRIARIPMRELIPTLIDLAYRDAFRCGIARPIETLRQEAAAAAAAKRGDDGQGNPNPAQ